jgi:hypothetical protein
VDEVPGLIAYCGQKATDAPLCRKRPAVMQYRQKWT